MALARRWRQPSANMVSTSLTIPGLASKVIRTEAEAKVAVRCPHCAAPAAFSAEALDPVGRMVRCARCGTAWLARFHSNDQYGTPRGESALLARRPGRPRFEQVIEHAGPDFAGKTPPPPVKPRKRAVSPRMAKPAKSFKVRRPKFDWLRLVTGRRAFQLWSASIATLILVVLVTLLTFNSSLLGGSAHSEMKQFAGLQIRLVRGALERVRDGHVLAVEGEITNRTNGEMEVPAVRVSLRSDGTERYSWLVEPTTTRLDAGGRVVFRSVLAAPPAGVDEVAFRLTERRNTIVGMR
jgi:predicted Zn finger-like uncharacterized protein